MKKFLKISLIIISVLVIAAVAFFGYRKSTQKTIAILLFDDFTMLEAVGAYQTFPGLYGENYRMKFVAKEKGMVKSSHIQSLKADYDFSEIKDADILYIPGGENMEKILNNESIINWIKEMDSKTEFTMSVGSGTLLLGKAELLKNKNATTHWYHQKELENFGAKYVNKNYIQDGKYFTGMGASASIDMVLALINKIAGEEQAKTMQLFIEYDPSPPVQSGTFEKADSTVKFIAQQLVEGSFPDTFSNKKTIAMLVYKGFTMLDITGPYQVFKELESFGYEMKFVAKDIGTIPSDMMLSYSADHIFNEVKNADILFIPGGSSTAKAMKDSETINWVKSIDSNSSYSTSVCTGSLMLAKARLLDNKNASCHWYAGQFLKDYNVNFTKKRYTIDGKYLTGAGVSSGIDLALLIVKEAVGEDYAKAIQLKMGYFPDPPFDAGSPEKSEKEAVAWLSKMFARAKEKYDEARIHN